MKIIGLVGRMGSGKDTVAALLAMRGYRRFAFADAIRDEVREAIKMRGYVDHPFSPLAIQALFHAELDEVDQKPTTPRMRALLQQWGDYRRAQNPNYWTDLTAKDIHGVDLVAISDVRFPDEADLIRRLGGVVWLIRRPSDEPINAHVSERGQFDVDLEIKNSGTVVDLAGRVMAALGAMA